MLLVETDALPLLCAGPMLLRVLLLEIDGDVRGVFDAVVGADQAGRVLVLERIGESVRVFVLGLNDGAP